jgi:hypothetical protein
LRTPVPDLQIFSEAYLLIDSAICVKF